VLNFHSPLNYRETALALFPERYPASDAPIELSTINSSFSDRDTEFWTVEAENLIRKFNQRVRERLAAGDIGHLSVFSLAPQPLLILLGTLLGDIVPSTSTSGTVSRLHGSGLWYCLRHHSM